MKGVKKQKNNREGNEITPQMFYGILSKVNQVI